MLREPSVATSERYEVIRPLGSGSYGVVYEALDTQSGQRVAIKELNELSASAIGHFKQEFRALADCHHPNLVGLRALIEDDGRWRIVMELVPGTDFLGYVRRADNDNAPERMACDEGRLRRALRGMAEGLAALHRYGVVHRDLKPANVRVTEEGRAVLLDFGLVTRIDAREQTANVLIGTAAYMAPELGREPELGPAADWYALGVCLFEALTGERPFEGRTVFELLELKQQAPAPRASSRVRDVPPDLDALCAGLLEREPAQRFGAAEVMGALTLPTVDDGAEARAAISSSGGSVFAGREAELSQLVRAQARSAGGERAIVLVEGESGVGKSELVAEFVRRFEVEQPSLLTLHGRCYENEQVVYKAFDGCIDDLARFLRHLPHADCERLLPLRAAVLGQLFPVLRSVSAIATAPRTHLSAEPMARRFEAFAALSALLAAVAATRPVVLVIDDLQWADAESFRLLHALVAYTESLPLLIVATLRPREELEPEVLEQVDRVRALRETRLVPLLGLPLPHAQELAGKLLGGGVSAEWLAMIARESEGHPLLLSELVRYTLTHGVRGAISLGGALRARIEQLEPAERSLLEMVAIAGRPFGSPVFAAALGVDSVEVPARKLLASKLLRLRRGIELGVYHDRIRHEAVSLVARSRLPSLHRRLAEALTRDPRSDASEQAHHWDRAGEIERAIDDYRTAATRALEALAFVRAAHLAQRALELLSDPRDPRVGPLTVQRATALACAGINAESAQLYLRAAHQAEGAERLMLRSRAAQQLLLSGDLKRGFAAAMALFAELDVRLPKTMLGYLASWIYDRLWGLWPRRFVVKPMRTAAEERGYLAYNIVDELMYGIEVLHPLASFAIAMAQVRLAARFGVPDGVGRAHSLLGWALCAGGYPERAEPFFAQGRRICAALGDPRISARQAYLEGSGRLSAGDHLGALEILERAHASLQTHAPDRPELIVNARYHLGCTLSFQGAYGRVARETELWLREARERNDRRAIALLTGIGHGFMRHLVRDQPEAALTELSGSVADFPPEPFSFIHYGHLLGMQGTLRYQGGDAALAWLEARRAEHRRSVLLRTGLGRSTLRTARALALVAAAAEAPVHATHTYLRQVKGMLPAMARDPVPFGRIHGLLIGAQLALYRGEVAEAKRAAGAARELAERTGLEPRYAAAYLDGLVTGGAAGARLQASALEAVRAEGCVAPRRVLALQLPLLARIE